MKSENLKQAIAEAYRFLERAEKVQEGDYGWCECGADAAATRRASLDLTKALAKLRRRDQ